MATTSAGNVAIGLEDTMMADKESWLPDWFWDDTEAERDAKRFILDSLVAHIEHINRTQTPRRRAPDFWPHTHPHGPIENWIPTPAHKPGATILAKPIKLPKNLVPSKLLWQGTVTHVEIHPDTLDQILAQSPSRVDPTDDLPLDQRTVGTVAPSRGGTHRRRTTRQED